MTILATAPVPAASRLDLADTVTMPLLDPFAPSWVPVPVCPIGIVWCAEHVIIDGADQSCHGETTQIDTDTREHPVQVYLSRLSVPAHAHVDESIIVSGGGILTAEQALQLAAVLTDLAQQLRGGDR